MTLRVSTNFQQPTNSSNRRGQTGALVHIGRTDTSSADDKPSIGSAPIGEFVKQGIEYVSSIIVATIWLKWFVEFSLHLNLFADVVHQRRSSKAVTTLDGTSKNCIDTNTGTSRVRDILGGHLLSS